MTPDDQYRTPPENFCPHCHMPNATTAQLCVNCGKPMTATSASSATLPTMTASNIPTVPPTVGRTLPPPVPIQTSFPPPAQEKSRWWVWAVFGVLLIGAAWGVYQIGLVLFAFLFPTEPPLILPPTATSVVAVATLPTVLENAGTPPPPTPLTPSPLTTLTPIAATEPTTTTLIAERTIIGSSFNNQEIELYRLGMGSKAILLIGGLHAGFAPSSVTLTQQAIDYFQKNSQQIPASVSLWILPNLNPDSALAPGEQAGRLNGNGVDLNRNFGCNWNINATWRDQPISAGTAPFSEPETTLLHTLITEIQPLAVIFYEARASNGLIAPGKCNDQTSGSEELAQLYHQTSGYEIYEGFSLTGDGADWLASQNIAAIAILLKDYTTLTSAEWEQNQKALTTLLENYSK